MKQFTLFSGVANAAYQKLVDLVIGNQYTYSDIVKNFGEPKSTGGQDWKTFQDLNYDGVQLGFEGGEFCQCLVTSDKFTMFGEGGTGGIKVGDNIDAVKKLRDARPEKCGADSYKLFTKSDWVVAQVYFNPATNVITKIKVGQMY